jgi:hypothetical protein
MTETKTKSWWWYCQLCGAADEAKDLPARDLAAAEHLNGTSCGGGKRANCAVSGRLLQIWTW